MKSDSNTCTSWVIDLVDTSKRDRSVYRTTMDAEDAHELFDKVKITFPGFTLIQYQRDI